ncbi:MAG: type II toxin-antitoxin system VapC family toxin [Deltaproteobacteria bacterium]|nr:type II toxin-antitoxin system VapC family toxin [Deltaproteobacteria bacterium]
MSYLLDTNVLSETVRPRPEPAVLEWLNAVPDEALCISALTLGEIRRGVEGLGPGRRRERLRVWLERELPAWFGERVLPVDREVADRWGRLVAEVGRPVPAIDSLLAATALHHELRLVTRNGRDFEYPGLVVIDPWEPG